MARRTVYLTSELMQEVTHRLAKSYFSEYNEPIPTFDKHIPALLDSALSLPRATFGRKELYPTLAAKAAVMFYALIKNHPFSNGNKRIATTALLVFLYLNNHWLDSEQRGIYVWAVRIAKSRADERNEILQKITSWLDKNVKKKSKIKNAGIFRRIWWALGLITPVYWIRRRRQKNQNQPKEKKQKNKHRRRAIRIGKKRSKK